MKSSWKIILIILVIGSISALAYFYCVGNKSNQDDKNITIVRRIIDSSNKSDATDDAQIDQISTNLVADIAALQTNKDAVYLNEIVQDLKNF